MKSHSTERAPLLREPLLTHDKYEVEGHPRHVGIGKGHLSECMLVVYPGDNNRCTCDDWSPEW